MTLFGKFFEKTPEKLNTPLGKEAVLESQEITAIRPLREGRDTSISFVRLKDSGLAVFKSSERLTLRSFEHGTLHKRERAAYLIDKFLGFDLVPPTVIREIDGKIGSLQEFIPNTKEGGISVNERNRPDVVRQLVKLWLLDFAIWSFDRCSRNLLYSEGKVYAIDNEFSFKNENPMFYKQFFDEIIPQDIIDQFEKFLSEIEGQKELRKELSRLLPPKDVEAFFARVKRIGQALSQYKKVPYSEFHF